MRILFFVHSLGRTRHFKDVITGLTARGHTVVLATAGRTETQKAKKGLYDSPNVEVTACPAVRTDEWGGAVAQLRRLRDRLRFFDPRYAHAHKLADRAASYVPKRWNRALERRPWLQRYWRLAQGALALAERLIPADPGFLEFIRAQSPDLILVTPLVEFGSYQTDYVKCAHRLGVPVAYLPFSWDNLTNRGLVRVPPDRTLVWNRHQQREAVELHGLPPDGVVVTGAPRFDAFFSMRPSTSRERFCGELGFDPARPLLLYVCSSGFIAPQEAAFVRRWIGELRAAAGTSWLRDCTVLIRPHPSYTAQWGPADLSDLPGVRVWAERSTMSGDRGLYDALFHATAVVGVNTSAMIEAAIVGRPVFTITVPEFNGGQKGTIHFGYLLAANGGVVIPSDNFGDHFTQVAAAPDHGADTDERSRRFLEVFVRPRGLDTPASGIMVAEIERAGAMRKRPQRTPLWHYPLRRALAARLDGMAGPGRE